MLRAICDDIEKGRRRFPDPYTITDFAIRPFANAGLSVTKALSRNGSLQLKQNGSPVALGELSLSHLEAFEDFLTDKSTSPTVYRKIKKDPDWQAIYGYAMRDVLYIINGSEIRKRENTVPCSECGVLLPEKLVSVDHQRAQSKSALEAVYKVFKTVGYTEQGQKGEKAQKVHASWSARVGGKSIGTGARTLNSVGVIVFSLFHRSDYQENLESLSLHNFINLRPVCVFCNSSLGAKNWL